MQIELTDDQDPAIRTAVLAPLLAYNTEMTGRSDPGGKVAVLFRDADGLVEGGLYATHWMGWMKLEMAYLPEHLRGQGLGARALATLERAAVTRGCHGLWLQSFSVQAPGFYEKQGYDVVARLADHPPGHENVFLAKTHGLGAKPASLSVVHAHDLAVDHTHDLTVDHTHDLTVDDDPDPAHRATLRRHLLAYTDARSGPSGFRDLAVLVRDAAGAILGGLWGYSGRSWLFVDLFGLPPELRRGGLGTRLLRMACDEAQARGCIGVWLDTFSFQARPFYEKQGFSCFGQIEDFPQGHTRFFLARRLPA